MRLSRKGSERAEALHIASSIEVLVVLDDFKSDGGDNIATAPPNVARRPFLTSLYGRDAMHYFRRGYPCSPQALRHGRLS